MHLLFLIIYYLVFILVSFNDCRQDCYTAILNVRDLSKICIIQVQYILVARLLAILIKIFQK